MTTRQIAEHQAKAMLGGGPLQSGEYAYYAEEISEWIVVQDGAFEELVGLIEDGTDDAYSHWCAGTSYRQATSDEIDEVT